MRKLDATYGSLKMNKKYTSVIIILISLLFLWVSAESKKIWFINFDKSKNILE